MENINCQQSMVNSFHPELVFFRHNDKKDKIFLFDRMVLLLLRKISTQKTDLSAFFIHEFFFRHNDKIYYS